jgi:type VI secretion system protein
MYKQRLLNRIRTLNNNKDSIRLTTTANTEIDSIKEHLGKLLTTRRNCTLIADDYGMRDIAHHSEEYFIEFMNTLEKDIYTTIAKFEQRLCDVVVTFETRKDSQLSLVFTIDAKLTSNKDYSISFATKLSTTGRVSLDDE